MSGIGLAADAGLAAMFAATFNLVLGTLMAARYSPVRNWPHRRLNLFSLHSWSGYTVLALSLFHPLILVLARRATGFGWRDIVFPVRSPVQPVINTIGAIALYLLLVVVVTSLYRTDLGRRRWKAFHFLVYAAAAGVFAHGLLANPDLKAMPIDYLDGEKVWVEICAALVVIAGVASWRVRTVRDQRDRRAGAGRYATR